MGLRDTLFRLRCQLYDPFGSNAGPACARGPRAIVRSAFLLTALAAAGSCAPTQQNIPSELTFEEWAATQLSSGEWTLTEMDGRPIILGANVGIHFILSFDRNGAVTGQACNRLGGQYRLEGQWLFIGPIAMTEITCSEQIDRLEGRFLQIMSVPNEIQFTPDGSLLIGKPARPALRLRPSRERQAVDKDDAGDLCNAIRYRYLVGQHRSAIPHPPAGATWRVTCSSCAVTMDFSERRLNIVYDEKTGIVKSVSCG
jgi:heat shock protein HslJ